MAAVDHVQNMNDVALKPRLLRSLTKHHLPDEKHPLKNPLHLSRVISTVKTHRLLSENPASQSADQKHIDRWKSAVDAWVNRLLVLVSSNMPDKCWAGICLLGLTCQECCLERFLASYSDWFQKLLSHIQPPVESHFVKVASCAAISDLLTRLGGLPNEKKEGTSHASKVLQPVLKLLSDDSSDAAWDGAVCLLCTVITFFPSSVHRHYDSAEAAIVSKIMSGKCNVNTLENLGHCLALLPKSRGDEDSWSLMMQKVLLSINVHLNDAFQGLEEESQCSEAMRVLVPPGKEPPPPLGGQTSSDLATKRPDQYLVSSVSTLMLCCSTMLTSSYPVQIPVPVKLLLMLAARILRVDGSLSQALYPITTTMQQELICSELPLLHMYSLELLAAVVKGVRSQLLPHAAGIVRLLTEYFRACVLPELKTKVYTIIRNLLMSMGVGMAVYLTQEVVNNAFADLGSTAYVNGEISSKPYLKVSTQLLQQPYQRKRKHGTIAGCLGEHTDRVGSEVSAPRNPTLLSVKIAALEALEALLTVGGALRSESWRSDVDRLIMTVATNACKWGWGNEGKDGSLRSDPPETWADYQLAALRALLASLLSPGRIRPPYLAHGLEIFRRGMQETGTKLAEFCAHALLALEVLIHPRALPLIDFASATNNSLVVEHRLPENIYSGGQKLNTSFSSEAPGLRHADPESETDDLYDSWLGNGDETSVPVIDQEKGISVSEKPAAIFGDPSADKFLHVDDLTGRKVPEESEKGVVAAGADKTIEATADEMIMETPKFQENVKQFEETENRTVDTAFGGVVSNAASFEVMDQETGSRTDASATTDVGLTTNSERSKKFAFELDNESSDDSLPDIVDGDPDSDYE